jgi:hypothetical protein
MPAKPDSPPPMPSPFKARIHTVRERRATLGGDLAEARQKEK